jgi:hypothetical protein
VVTMVALVTRLTRVDGQTDVVSPICIFFMHFVQTTH